MTQRALRQSRRLVICSPGVEMLTGDVVGVRVCEAETGLEYESGFAQVAPLFEVILKPQWTSVEHREDVTGAVESQYLNGISLRFKEEPDSIPIQTTFPPARRAFEATLSLQIS
jgi:hypothetical protein